MKIEFCQMLQMIISIFFISLARVAFDRNYERIHKGWKKQSVVLFILQRRRGAKGGELDQQQNVAALNFYWIIKGVGSCYCVGAGMLGVLQHRRFFVGFA